MLVLLFILFGGLAIGCAVNVVAQRNPLYCAISLIGVFVSLASLYLMLAAPFIAAVQIIVYAGAIMPIAILSSWTSIKKRQLAYYSFLLILASAMIGVFVSLDLLLFYLFFEASLIPMFFLIGIWGGERRIYAAIKFFIYTAVGSLLMLVAIIALYFTYHTFDYTALIQAIQAQPLPERYQFLLFLAFALAFCIKVPLFPLHTWLPDAHTEAPTAGSVILAGVLLKMGTYGLLRFNLGLFPVTAHAFAPVIIVLAIIGIIYGALVAMVQPNMSAAARPRRTAKCRDAG